MSFLNINPSIKPLDSIFNSWPIGLLDFKVFWDMDFNIQCFYLSLYEPENSNYYKIKLS